MYSDSTHSKVKNTWRWESYL